jgi:polysaccharide pyruvyl transferase WcaK-like protein
MAILARLFRKRLIFYCLGIGPLNSFINKKLCRFAANLAEMISVRDSESKELLRNLGVTKEICAAADPVFWLKPIWNEKVERLINVYHLGQQKPLIFVCVHSLLPWNTETRKIIAENLDTLVRERDAQIVFLPLGMYKNRWIQAESSDTVDIVTSKELAALMKEKSSVLTDGLSPQECLAVIQHADLVISMRFHGVVMGMNMGVPVIVLTFRQEIKLRNLMRWAEQDESCFDVGELEQEIFLERIESVLSKTEEIQQQLTESVVILQTKLKKCHELLFETLMDTSH